MVFLKTMIDCCFQIIYLNHSRLLIVVYQMCKVYDYKILIFVLLMFQDIVDILVGWHIDTSQSIDTNKRISQCIFRLSTYWTADMSFTLGLLEQLLEDMSSISDEFEHSEKTDEISDGLNKILAFIRYKIS